MPLTEAVADLHKIAQREYRRVRVLNYAVYCSLSIALGSFFYLALTASSPLWIVATTAALMLTVIATAFRAVWYGTYDRFLMSMAVQRPASIYSTVFKARAER